MINEDYSKYIFYFLLKKLKLNAKLQQIKENQCLNINTKNINIFYITSQKLEGDKGEV